MTGIALSAACIEITRLAACAEGAERAQNRISKTKEDKLDKADRAITRILHSPDEYLETRKTLENASACRGGAFEEDARPENELGLKFAPTAQTIQPSVLVNF
jgi:hypothetical protein